MKKRYLTLFSVLFAAILALTASPVLALGETIDLSYVRQNESGQGYRWDNINDVLYLTDLKLSTAADFGIKLPAGATVVVEGDCRVAADRYAISCLGSVTFKGTGKLTAEGGECGMYFYSTNRDHKVLFLGGEYAVKGGDSAIRSDGAEISFCGWKLSLEGKAAVRGIDVTVTGCEITAAGAIRAAHLLSVNGANVSAFDENGPALASDGRISLENVRIETGADRSSLSSADGYAGENAVRLASTYKRQRTSVLFGEGTPGWVDTLAFIGAGVGAVAALTVPFAVKAHKKKKLYERLNKESSGIGEAKKK